MVESIITLRQMFRQLPSPVYAEEGSVLHWSLEQLGWKKEHELSADGKYFIKLRRPDSACTQDNDV